MIELIKALLKKKGAKMIAPKKKNNKIKKIKKVKEQKVSLKKKPKLKLKTKKVSVSPRKTKKTEPERKVKTKKAMAVKSTQHKIHVEYEQIKKMLQKMRMDIINELTKKKNTLEAEKTVEIEDLDAIAEDRNREYEYLLTTMDTKKLKQIDEALAKIEQGTYGICEECGEEIPVARLKILPFAKLCIDCVSNVEKEEALKQSLESEKDIFTAGNNEEESDIE
jgi:DnaK suppressor protein